MVTLQCSRRRHVDPAARCYETKLDDNTKSSLFYEPLEIKVDASETSALICGVSTEGEVLRNFWGNDTRAVVVVS